MRSTTSKMAIGGPKSSFHIYDAICAYWLRGSLTSQSYHLFHLEEVVPMTVFRLKQLASTSAHAAVGAMRWNYDRAELIADGIVHGIGVFSALIAVTVLI